MPPMTREPGERAASEPSQSAARRGFPPWEISELPQAPVFRARHWTLLIGPGLLMAGANIGGGEWLMGLEVSARFGGTVLWLATVSIALQAFYNLAVMRYTLFSGESIFVGFFRTPPGPRFWIVCYFLLDVGTYWPYLAAGAAVPLASVLLGRLPTLEDDALVRGLSYAVFISAFVPLIFGGKVYNVLEKVMVVKLVLVLGYLGLIALFWVSWETKTEIASGFVRFGALPSSDFSWAALAAFAAIAGAGGLTNTSFSNYARDKGWGMGAKVGAIPSAVGGKTIQLSHTGRVFHRTPESLQRWRGWLRHILRDQLVLWVPACLIGVALPAMLSYEFNRGAEVQGHAAAAQAASGVAARHGQLFWFLTLACGFIILYPTQISQLDGISRRWTDVIWVGWRRLRGLGGHQVKYVYYTLLGAYLLLGLVALRLAPNPQVLAKAAGVMVNFGLGFSALHVLHVNMTLLPERLRPPWPMRAGLAGCALFFVGISCIAFSKHWSELSAWLGL
jgi:hypothetical protein